MFNKKMKLVFNMESGTTVTTYIYGRKYWLNLEIERIKKTAKKFEMFRNGMVVWH